jgi:hypothetical protein
MIPMDRKIKIRKKVISSRNIRFGDLFATNIFDLAGMNGVWLVALLVNRWQGPFGVVFTCDQEGLLGKGSRQQGEKLTEI